MSEAHDPNEELLEEAWDLLDHGKPEEAMLRARRVLRDDPQSAEALLVLARGALDTHATDEALIYAERAVDVEPESPEPRIELAYVLGYHLDRAADALAAAREALKAAQALNDPPAVQGAQLCLARMLLLGNRPSEAMEVAADLRAVRDAEPDWVAAVAELLMDLGDAEGAEALVRQALRKAEDDIGLRRLLAEILWFDDRLEEARAELEAILEVEPEDLEALIGLALLLVRALGDDDAALQACDRAMALAEDAGDAALVRWAKVLALARLGRRAEAQAERGSAGEGPFDNAENHIVAGLALKELGEPALARDHVKRALSLDPQNEDAQELLAELPGNGGAGTPIAPDKVRN
ncbi:MAG TPA: tetratricopeptide repeat protein [Myxococcota bacterium]|jgi:tetratricopeptide (TPR) repeat protein|nr:tetratricopeptide repeat protein [Myxococcota bacterium]